VVAQTLFELAGGSVAIRRITGAFYERVFTDPLLAPLFRDPGDDHAERLAMWLTELLGGPAEHTASRGGFVVMRGAHVGLRISNEQRQRWVALMFEACRDVGMDDAFMRRFLPYVEGGSTLAQRVSWPGDERGPR